MVKHNLGHNLLHKVKREINVRTKFVYPKLVLPKIFSEPHAVPPPKNKELKGKHNGNTRRR